MASHEPEQTADDLVLPPLDLGPIKMPAGNIRCVLRPQHTCSAKIVGTFDVSRRLKEPIFELPDGERLLISGRKITSVPTGVDGVLLRQDDGSLKWQSHSIIEKLETDAALHGWSKVVTDRARQWDGKFVFNSASRALPDTVAEGLRPPQLGALHAVGAHWSISAQPATVVMPTGTGKTETMLSILAAYVRRPMLVAVPSDALRAQTAKKFLTFGLLRQLGVLDRAAPNPIVGIITKVPNSLDAVIALERCNVIISTMSCLADSKAEPFWSEVAKRIGVLVIDEAHHIGASRWSSFREALSALPTLQFTATPFRRDGNLVDGEVIYSYPLRMAQTDGYFKHIKFEPVYEPLQSDADMAIAELAVSRLRSDVAAGLNHLMMARCSKIERATAVHEIYAKLAPELQPMLVHSEITDASQKISDLQAGKSRIVVCVNMLGEGFDLPQLKVAAIHDLHKSLAILLQFTGRFTRTASNNIGDASVVANVADPNVSAALERLYSEDADWSELLSEMSSEAANDHARLTKFLNETLRLDELREDDDEVAITHKLLRPTLSTLVYEADKFTPKKFHEGLLESSVPYRVWLHQPSNTLFFVTRSMPSLKWSRSKAVRDTSWALFVLHFDSHRKLLYLSSTDHDSDHKHLAESVGAGAILRGDTIFRAMGRITRLIFQNVGVKKHGRRNLSYASYSGAEVVTALGLAEKSGSVKAVLSGQGWEAGKQITIGCSAKGRVWSREQGSIPRFNEWSELIGDKLRDPSIDTAKLIDNVLLPQVVELIPEAELFSIDWPIEILRQPEERVEFSQGANAGSQTTFELGITAVDRSANTIDFDLNEALTGKWATFRFSLGGANEFEVKQTSGADVLVSIGKINQTLAEYFSAYPPLFRFIDLSELDANLHIVPQTPYDLQIDDRSFEPWDWSGVDLTKESLWKDGAERADSVQWHVAQEFIAREFDVVFDDDASGEAADLVCMKLEADHIALTLVHCKFSGAEEPGGRVKDVVEVASQAVRSARWVGKFPQLCQHVRAREEKLKRADRPSRFLRGAPSDVVRLTKLSRFRVVRPHIVVVQPGIRKSARTAHQSVVLAAALTFLKETVGIDLSVVCSM